MEEIVSLLGKPDIKLIAEDGATFVTYKVILGLCSESLRKIITLTHDDNNDACVTFHGELGKDLEDLVDLAESNFELIMNQSSCDIFLSFKNQNECPEEDSNATEEMNAIMEKDIICKDVTLTREDDLDLEVSSDTYDHLDESSEENKKKASCDDVLFKTELNVEEMEKKSSCKKFQLPDDPLTIVKKSKSKKKQRKNVIPKKVPCELCGKLLTKNYKSMHMILHSSSRVKVACTICDKVLFEDCMKMHMKLVHWKLVGIQPSKLSCHICGKMYNDYKLSTHLLSHEEKKPCKICGVYVKDMDHHMKAVHLPEDQKKHKCPECGKGFYYTRELTQHRINNHLKNRPFQCRYGCDIKYNDASNRYSHEKKKHGGLFKNQQNNP